MFEDTIKKLNNCLEELDKKTVADGILYQKAGEDPKIIRGEDIDKEVIKLGLFLELHEIKYTGLVAVYDSRKSFDLGGKKYVFGPLMIMHKGEKNTECLTEDEICCSAIILMDAEVKLSYDGTEFRAFEFN